MYNIQDKDIVIFHIGGSLGDYGPIVKTVQTFPNNCIVFVFEARSEASSIEQYNDKGTRVVIVNECIGKAIEERDFYVNKYPESSSLFPTNPKAAKEHILPFVSPNDIRTWGENTVLDHIIKVNTTTIKDFIDKNDIIPDILSIDAQGAELEIMLGVGDYFRDIITVVSEVEFLEIYLGQCLFHHQFDFLTKQDFRLVDIFHQQMWSKGPEYGKGFLVAGEALWFKDICNLEMYKTIKLAAISYSFDRFSYTYTLLKKLIEVDKDQVVNIFNQFGYEKLLSIVDMIDNNLENYRIDKYFFINKYFEEGKSIHDKNSI
jgi:FkbM family methyltransferase